MWVFLADALRAAGIDAIIRWSTKKMQKRIIGIARERSAKIGDEIFDGKR